LASSLRAAGRPSSGFGNHSRSIDWMFGLELAWQPPWVMHQLKCDARSWASAPNLPGPAPCPAAKDGPFGLENRISCSGLPRLLRSSRIWANAGRCHSSSPAPRPFGCGCPCEGRPCLWLAHTNCPEIDVAPLRPAPFPPLRPCERPGGRPNRFRTERHISPLQTSTFSTGSAGRQASAATACWR